MKNEGLILNIETSTTVCSVALSLGTGVIAIEEVDSGYTHAENLHLFIDAVLTKKGYKPTDLKAVALSSGPGSYTGLRIGSSTAKGLCFALNIPLITLSTLKIMAGAVAADQKFSTICPMLDAGRMEVYTAAFTPSLDQTMEVRALILDENSIKIFENLSPVLFVGQGMEKAKHVLEQVEGSSFIDGIKPSARFMAGLSNQAFKDGAFTQLRDFEPFYLKNFVAGKPKK